MCIATKFPGEGGYHTLRTTNLDNYCALQIRNLEWRSWCIVQGDWTDCPIEKMEELKLNSVLLSLGSLLFFPLHL